MVAIASRFTPASMIRKGILAWLSAVLIEYLLLPKDLKDLSKLDGLAQMSFMNVLIVTLGIFALLILWGATRGRQRLERSAFAAVFALLSAAKDRIRRQRQASSVDHRGVDRCVLSLRQHLDRLPDL